MQKNLLLSKKYRDAADYVQARYLKFLIEFYIREGYDFISYTDQQGIYEPLGKGRVYKTKAEAVQYLCDLKGFTPEQVKERAYLLVEQLTGEDGLLRVMEIYCNELKSNFYKEFEKKF